MTVAPAPRTRDRGPWVVGLALTGLVAAVYGQVRSFAFVNFDDGLYVYENEVVRRGLTGPGLAWALTAFHASNWHPLTWLSHMADVELFGLTAGWHHLVNVLFHWVNAVGLFLVLRSATGSLWRSGFAAALFAVHPLHVESVAWVSERKDVLSTSFWLLAMALHTRHARQLGARPTLALALAFGLGLLCKPMLVTLPVVLLLLDVWPLERMPGAESWSWRRVLPLAREKVPLLALSALSSAMTFAAQARGSSVVPASALSLGERLGHAAVSYVAYLGKAIWPAALAMFYPYDAEAIAREPVGASAAVLAAITAAAIWQWKPRPYIAVGWFWYLVTLLPVIGLVQVGNQAMADRYTYLPLIGPFIAVAWGLGDAVARWPRLRIPLAGTAGGLVVAAAGAAYVQTGHWRDSFSLYAHTLDVTTGNWTAWNGLAYAHHSAGRPAEAARCFREALRVRPGEAGTWRDLGLVLAQMNDHPAAIQALRQAVAIAPADTRTWVSLGASYGALGQHEAAMRAFQEALRWSPSDAEALFDLGLAYAHLGQVPSALEVQRSLAKLDPAAANRLLQAIRGGGGADR